MEIKCQLDATEVFIADLIACSTCFGHHCAHHQELKSIIQWLLPVVFRAVVFKLLVWCGAEGYVSGLQDAGLFTHINDDALSKSRQILKLILNLNNPEGLIGKGGKGEATRRDSGYTFSYPLLFCWLLLTSGKNDKTTLNSAWGLQLVRSLAYALPCRTFVSEYVLETLVVTDEGGT